MGLDCDKMMKTNQLFRRHSEVKKKMNEKVKMISRPFDCHESLRDICALSQGPDRWRLRLRAPTHPASPVAPVAGPLQALRRCRRASTGTAGGPAHRGSVAGPGQVAAPSPGSYPPGVAVAPIARLLPARRRCRQAPTGGGSVNGLIPAATRLHVRMAPTPVGKVTTPLACQ